MNITVIDEALVRKVLSTVDVGLCKGKGVQIPGKMCVEAAVCFALDLPHSDRPPCVHSVVRSFKIRLNDSNWSSDKARAAGMRRIAVAQLGSLNIDTNKFLEYVAIATVTRILPLMIERLSKRFPTISFESVSSSCKAATTREEAVKAAKTLETLCKTAYAAYAAAAYAAYAADAAAYAAAAYAAYAADAAVARDDLLTLSADIATEALIACGSEGASWLWLCKEIEAPSS